MDSFRQISYAAGDLLPTDASLIRSLMCRFHPLDATLIHLGYMETMFGSPVQKFFKKVSEHPTNARPQTKSQMNKEQKTTKKIRKPKAWKHSQPITRTELKRMREEFWDTAPHYGGQKEIWDALRAAAEADLNLAQAIVDSAGVIVTSADMTTCYDERARISATRYTFPLEFLCFTKHYWQNKKFTAPFFSQCSDFAPY
ncbi:hypothetical protein ACLOJK_008697 [Asimina triloba]